MLTLRSPEDVSSLKFSFAPWELMVPSICEGGVDVIGVVTPLRGGAQVVLHGDEGCRAQCAARGA